jgi:hypothetical protein
LAFTFRKLDSVSLVIHRFFIMKILLLRAECTISKFTIKIINIIISMDIETTFYEYLKKCIVSYKKDILEVDFIFYFAILEP